ncbi:MAG: hypothetical protein ACRDDX_07135 [Cellulosilyticaceae bacterium]
MISKIKKLMKVVGIGVIIASIIYGMVGYMFLDVTKGFLAIIGEDPESKDDAGNLIIDLTPYVDVEK